MESLEAVKGNSWVRVCGLGMVLVAFTGSCGGSSVRNGSSPTAGRAGADTPPAIGGTDAGGSGGSAAGGASGAGGASQLECKASAPRGEYGGGFELCDGSDMRVHRTSVSSCKSALPRASLPPISELDQCASDQECTAEPNGFCDSAGNGFGRVCQYGCLVDADCDAGSVCLCGTWIGYCTPAECATDADCGPGLLCTAYWKQCHQHVGFACQNPADLCFDDQSCPGGLCEREADGIRRCAERECLLPAGG